ncbi:MAG: hypothetical protein RMJ97_09910 [Raineya sp.]|nr:hypothetical protein [Raineya sp.]
MQLLTENGKKNTKNEQPQGKLYQLAKIIYEIGFDSPRNKGFEHYPDFSENVITLHQELMNLCKDGKIETHDFLRYSKQLSEMLFSLAEFYRPMKEIIRAFEK